METNNVLGLEICAWDSGDHKLVKAGFCHFIPMKTITHRPHWIAIVIHDEPAVKLYELDGKGQLVTRPARQTPRRMPHPSPVPSRIARMKDDAPQCNCTPEVPDAKWQSAMLPSDQFDGSFYVDFSFESDDSYSSFFAFS
jgi:hypothetical protein